MDARELLLITPQNPTLDRMEKTETKPETEPEKKEKAATKAPPKLRTAHCLTCGNEWMASNGNEKRPSRCPQCMKRRVRWADEVAPEERMTRKEIRESQHKKQEKKEEQPAQEPEKVATPEPQKEPQPETKPEKKIPEKKEPEKEPAEQVIFKATAAMKEAAKSAEADKTFEECKEEWEEKTGGMGKGVFFVALGIIAVGGVLILFRQHKSPYRQTLRDPAQEYQRAQAEREAARIRQEEIIRARINGPRGVW